MSKPAPLVMLAVIWLSRTFDEMPDKLAAVLNCIGDIMFISYDEVIYGEEDTLLVRPAAMFGKGKSLPSCKGKYLLMCPGVDKWGTDEEMRDRTIKYFENLNLPVEVVDDFDKNIYDTLKREQASRAAEIEASNPEYTPSLSNRQKRWSEGDHSDRWSDWRD